VISASESTLIAVGRRHWRSFLPMWLFPVAFLFSVFLPGFSSHPSAYFFLLCFPVMLTCFWVAAGPRRAGLVTTNQAAFWVIIVPFLIWTTLIGCLFGLGFLLGAFAVK
jgi:hypothetical protein